MITWIKTLLKVVREYESTVKAQKVSAKFFRLYCIDAAARFEKLETRVDDLKDAVRIANNAATSARESAKYIKDRTEVHADVNINDRRPNSVIIIGRYKGRDYVEVFDVEDIDQLVHQFKSMQRHHHRGILDGPPGFKAYIDTSFKWE